MRRRSRTTWARSSRGEGADPREGILSHKEGVDLMPANIELAGMEMPVLMAMSREQLMNVWVSPLKADGCATLSEFTRGPPANVEAGPFPENESERNGSPEKALPQDFDLFKQVKVAPQPKRWSTLWSSRPRG